MKLTRGNKYLDTLDWIKRKYYRIKRGLFYIFNKDCVHKKIEEYKKYSDCLHNVGIRKPIDKYDIILLAEDVALFNGNFSIDEYFHSFYGAIGVTKNM